MFYKYQYVYAINNIIQIILKINHF